MIRPGDEFVAGSHQPDDLTFGSYVVDPGLVDVVDWPDDTATHPRSWVYGAVGLVP